MHNHESQKKLRFQRAAGKKREAGLELRFAYTRRAYLGHSPKQDLTHRLYASRLPRPRSQTHRLPQGFAFLISRVTSHLGRVVLPNLLFRLDALSQSTCPCRVTPLTFRRERSFPVERSIPPTGPIKVSGGKRRKGKEIRKRRTTTSPPANVQNMQKIEKKSACQSF